MYAEPPEVRTKAELRSNCKATTQLTDLQFHCRFHASPSDARSPPSGILCRHSTTAAVALPPARRGTRLDYCYSVELDIGALDCNLMHSLFDG